MMKFLILALAVASGSVYAAPKKIWTVYDTEHPLWTALKIEAVNGIKAVGGLTCERTEGVRLSTTCTFRKDIKKAGVHAIYQALNVKPIDTSGSYTEVKVVDRLIVVDETDTNQQNNNNRYYLDHACVSVNTEKEAAKCMEFYATEVLPSFEETNDTAVVKMNDDSRALLAESLRLQGYNPAYVKKALKMVEGEAFVGLMQEHQDEHHLYYFKIKVGEPAIPVELSDFNVADVAYVPIGEEAKSVDKKDRAGYVANVLSHLFLGLNNDIFSEVADEVETGIDYIIEEQN